MTPTYPQSVIHITPNVTQKYLQIDFKGTPKEILGYP